LAFDTFGALILRAWDLPTVATIVGELVARFLRSS
jgi:hypothetical protein